MWVGRAVSAHGASPARLPERALVASASADSQGPWVPQDAAGTTHPTEPSAAGSGAGSPVRIGDLDQVRRLAAPDEPAAPRRYLLRVDPRQDLTLARSPDISSNAPPVSRTACSTGSYIARAAPGDRPG